MYCQPLIIGYMTQHGKYEPAVRWPDEKRGPWVIRVQLAPVGGRLECVRLEVANEKVRKKAITTALMREIPWASVIDDAREEEERRQRRGELKKKGRSKRLPSVVHCRGPGRPRLDDEHFQRVAAVYLEAFEWGRDPTKAVADELHPTQNRNTAARWVSIARKKKLIPPTTRGRAGGRATNPRKGQR